MRKIIHRAESRGFADHGWLKTHHTFSFAGYFDRERVHFGALRVINDDTVLGGEGFGTHPHDNMEIVSIPLKGALEHEDSMGNKGVIRPGQIQVMSAGSGITHSEYNASKTEPVHFLQIWVFTQMDNLTPRYNDIVLNKPVKNELQLIVAPQKEGTSNIGWIHQRAWFYLAELGKGKSVVHAVHSDNHGVYLFVISGSVVCEGETLGERDGMGVWETGKVEIKAANPAHILLMEVPMKF